MVIDQTEARDEVRRLLANLVRGAERMGGVDFASVCRAWLAMKMSVPGERCHVRAMNVMDCLKAIIILRRAHRRKVRRWDEARRRRMKREPA